MEKIVVVLFAFAFSLTSTQLSSTTTTTTIKPNESSISVRQCNEYKDFAYNKIYVSNLFGPAKEKLVLDCPFIQLPLIIGGTEAKISEFPHMALIGFEDGNIIHWSCGGTLISEQFVLTAAHCFNSWKYGPAKYVRLGENDLGSDNDGTTTDLRIIESIPHPLYRNELQYNDIGLLKLERKIELNRAIRPACLPEKSFVPTSKAIATGWGEVAWRGHRSNALLKVTLDLFSHSDCSNSMDVSHLLPRGIKEKTQLCAGSYAGKNNTCLGDSGGPLQIYHGTHECTYTIIGVTSFGKACGSIRTTGVYTRVIEFVDWIEGIVWQ